MTTLVEIAVIAAVAFALSYIPVQTANAAIDISLGLIPLAILAFRRGFLPAMTAGFIWGLLSIISGKAFILTAIQVIIEYPIAFAFGGLVGIFAHQVKTKRNNVPWLIASVFTGVIARWFWHFLAGVIFWGSYAPKGMSPYWYSFVMNGTSALANAVLISIILVILVKKAPKLLNP
ncbi:energy-coupled thiamine transporter ThiT [Enterococcus sp. MMGLQ5-2]|nr:energy-coupled thiamine transporter ThiT [Enterococcus sp. MMGLQ5-2]MBS7585302.1 energy-coupled thiamine transporter ThiT [Enterococcus sp. MMGLQ5-1]NPD13159.1 energy-coupled thiamine transporter ThiT [Enterococcus sp. MMGLQ5-1]NPD37839.1 energy-coupled thiamine transporter ThiT [Enterococcus sp. MMGLQ5-2]